MSVHEKCGEKASADIVIVGAGLAGLYAALKLAPRPVTIFTAAKLGEGASSSWAQGGIAAAIEPGDHADDHAADTIRAGAGIVDLNIAHLLADEAAVRIHDLLEYGVPFDRDLAGRLKLSREAAHGARRVVRVKGDSAGKAIMDALITAARSTPSIQIVECAIVREIITESGKVRGVRVWPASIKSCEPVLEVRANAVVLAAGGTGGLYAVTTNPCEANGEALALAARAGAVIADAEFVQFHPTAINDGSDPAGLATEALRGEGSHLINANGERFMKELHPDAELAPRDIVARAVYAQVERGSGAFLDCRAAVGEKFPEEFPSVYEKCRSAGIDPVHEPIPVVPAAHYHMGGIWSDKDGRTSLDGLWACGEVASTGAHGANRLASNSLLEAVVFAGRIADDLRLHLPLPDSLETECISPALFPVTGETGNMASTNPSVMKLRKLMSRYGGVIRDHDGLVQALREIERMKVENQADLRIQNMLVAASFIITGALERTESRGGHYRTDHPLADPDQAKRSHLTLERINEIAEKYLEPGETQTAREKREARS